MDAGADHGAAGRDGTERRRNQGADGREEQRRVQLLGRPLVRGAGPFGAKAQREFDRRPVARPGEGENPAALGAGDLGDDVRRRAEAVQTEAFGIARHGERAVADEPGAEQWRRVDIAAPAAHGQAVAARRRRNSRRNRRPACSR